MCVRRPRWPLALAAVRAHASLGALTVRDRCGVRGGGEQTLQPFVIDIDSKTAMPAWIKAVSEMVIGDVWELFIPHEMGYGAKGTKNGKVKRTPPPCTARVAPMGGRVLTRRARGRS